jgi:hypothetical protein
MKPYLYVFLFAFLLLFLKAFYFDAWYETKNSDNNVSTENSTSEQSGIQEDAAHDDDFSQRGKGIEKITPEEALAKKESNLNSKKADNSSPVRNTGMYDKEKMPIDKLGDGIANSLRGKISN